METLGGLGGDDGFGAGALVAAGQAVDVAGGAGPAAFECGVAGLAEEGRGGRGPACRPLVEGELGRVLALGGGEGYDVVVEAGDGDAAVVVVERGEDSGEDVGGVGDGAAVDAGVEVVGGAGDGEFHVDQAADAVGDGGEPAANMPVSLIGR